ncbi:MAG: helix-turn-helix transcriptional regulator [Prevotellaceae bacterium]|nr:helix-turn-helix transcriptional regulator [Prevotellaceae bacterium]
MNNQVKTEQTREQVCSLIKKIRMKKGLSTHKLELLSGVRSENISNIENCRRSVGIDLLLKLTNALDCEILIKEK